jgi:hypothetical protein
MCVYIYPVGVVMPNGPIYIYIEYYIYVYMCVYISGVGVVMPNGPMCVCVYV